jgi:dienelactone hydrolase
MNEQAVRLAAGDVLLDGDVTLPAKPEGLVIFAHGSGSSRKSSRNRFVASQLNDAGFATLLFDLLTASEEAVDIYTAQYRFDIPRLAGRLVQAVQWARAQGTLRDLPIGLFGASTGGGAALVAAAEIPSAVSAVVSRGGRPDLAGPALEKVRCPTLLIVGGNDPVVIDLNREALAAMSAPKLLEIVPGASHLFEEPGTLEEVAQLAVNWFADHLVTAAPSEQAQPSEPRAEP